MLLARLRRIAVSEEPALKRGRRVCLGIVVLAAALMLAGRIQLVRTREKALLRDFTQDYLMGKALNGGEDPYRPVVELVQRHFESPPVAIASPPPSPHPPLVGLLFRPLAGLSIEDAGTVWLLLSVLAGAAAASIMILEMTPFRSAWAFLFATAALLLTSAGAEDLLWGQFNFILLLLIVMSWYFLRRGKDWQAGAVLGLCFSLKLLFWPLALFYGVRGRWRVLAAFTLVALCLGMVSLLAVGRQAAGKYFLEVLPQTSRYWADDPANTSVYSALVKLAAPPLIHTGNNGADVGPHPADPGFKGNDSITRVAMAVSLCLLVAGLVRSRREEEAEAFSRVFIASIAVAPLSWGHYALLLTFPLMVLGGKTIREQSVAPVALLKLLSIIILLMLNFRVLFYLSVECCFPPGMVLQLPWIFQLIWLVPPLLYLFLFLA